MVSVFWIATTTYIMLEELVLINPKYFQAAVKKFLGLRKDEIGQKILENYLIPEELALISAKSSKSLSSFPVPVVDGNRSAKIPFSKLSKA